MSNTKPLTTGDVVLQRLIRQAWLQSATATRRLRAWCAENPKEADKIHDRRLGVLRTIWKKEELHGQIKITDGFSIEQRTR